MVLTTAPTAATTTSSSSSSIIIPHGEHHTYTVFINGSSILTTVTNDHAAVSAWISSVRSSPRRTSIASLSVESRDSFPAATVQICVGRRCLIYQIMHARIVPHSLADLLSDSDFTFVGVDAHSDLERLNDEYDVGAAARAVDLGPMAAALYGRKRLVEAGVEELARLVLGREIEKEAEGVRRMSGGWFERRLTDDHVKCACVDAYVSLEIGTRLISKINGDDD